MAFAGQAVSAGKPLNDCSLGVPARLPCAAPPAHRRALRRDITRASGTETAQHRVAVTLIVRFITTVNKYERTPVSPADPQVLCSTGQNGSAAVAPQTLSISLDKWPQAEFIRVGQLASAVHIALHGQLLASQH